MNEWDLVMNQLRVLADHWDHRGRTLREIGDSRSEGMAFAYAVAAKELRDVLTGSTVPDRLRGVQIGDGNVQSNTFGDR